MYCSTLRTKLSSISGERTWITKARSHCLIQDRVSIQMLQLAILVNCNSQLNFYQKYKCVFAPRDLAITKIKSC